MTTTKIYASLNDLLCAKITNFIPTKQKTYAKGNDNARPMSLRLASRRCNYGYMYRKIREI